MENPETTRERGEKMTRGNIYLSDEEKRRRNGQTDRQTHGRIITPLFPPPALFLTASVTTTSLRKPQRAAAATAAEAK